MYAIVRYCNLERKNLHTLIYFLYTKLCKYTQKNKDIFIFFTILYNFLISTTVWKETMIQIAPHKLCHTLHHWGCVTHCSTQVVPHTAPLRLCHTLQFPCCAKHYITQSVSHTVTHCTTQAVPQIAPHRLCHTLHHPGCITHCTTQCHTLHHSCYATLHPWCYATHCTTQAVSHTAPLRLYHTLHHRGCATYYITQVVPHIVHMFCHTMYHTSRATHCTTQDVPHTAPHRMCHTAPHRVSHTLPLKLLLHTDCVIHCTTQVVPHSAPLRNCWATHYTTQGVLHTAQGCATHCIKQVVPHTAHRFCYIMYHTGCPTHCTTQVTASHLWSSDTAKFTPLPLSTRVRGGCVHDAVSDAPAWAGYGPLPGHVRGDAANSFDTADGARSTPRTRRTDTVHSLNPYFTKNLN